MGKRNVYGFCDAGCKYPVMESDGTVVRYVNGGLMTDRGEFVELGQSSIVRGSYIGTGTYGTNNPNVLTFERPVKMLVIMPPIAKGANTAYYQPDYDGEYYSGSSTGTAIGKGSYGTPLFLFGAELCPVVSNFDSSSDYDAHIQVLQWGNVVSWYSTGGSGNNSADYQRNARDCTYHYIAFMS